MAPRPVEFSQAFYDERHGGNATRRPSRCQRETSTRAAHPKPWMCIGRL